MEYIAFVTKGLEEISEKEIKYLKESKILSLKQKTIHFEYSEDIKELKSLKTVDDIGIYISEIPIEKLLELNLQNELEKIKKSIGILQTFRNIEEGYSLTISKYKNNDIKEEELKELLSNYFSHNLGFEYTPLNHSNLDIRVNITQQECLITLKLFPNSLFRRDYAHDTCLGSIRSTIAASMLYELLGNNKGLKVVDNFCGSGTFLCEALMMGEEVSGNDIDKLAVNTTLRNLNKIKKDNHQISNLDAIKTKWQDEYFDIVISNFPWNKQIKVDRMMKLIDLSIKEYSRILKRNSKLGFISTKPEVVIKILKKYFNIVNIETYKIGYLGQIPTIIIVEVIRSQ